MSKPIVSVTMAVFNDEKHIKYAIESVAKQTFNNWEFIIIDDASTDNTSKIIDKFRKSDKRIKYYKFESNMGVPAGFNRAVEMSIGNYVARIDSDDEWINKNKLKKQLDFMEKNHDFSLVGTWAKVIDKKDKNVLNLNLPKDDWIIRNQMLKHNCFITSSVLIRRTSLNKIELSNTHFKYAEDYILWLKLGTVGKFHNLPEYMTQYRINPSGISQNKSIEQINTSLYAIKKYKKFYPHYFQAFLLWNIRKYYPKWFRGPFSINIKKKIASLTNTLSLNG